MPYHVKEIFYTLQGEGAHAGRPAVFCRFAGCNLWSGREEDRATAQCRFCDTDFLGGHRFESCGDLAWDMANVWPGHYLEKFAVLTGGEPALQFDRELYAALKVSGFEVAIETNGTVPFKAYADWICVSPKAGTKLAITTGNELKLVFPQVGLDPEELLRTTSFDRYSLQPMDGADVAANTTAALDYCLTHPAWRLSLQTHKILEIR